MRSTPFNDIWLFLIGDTDSHHAVGAWRFLLVALYWSLIAVSIALAYRNSREDPAQRTLPHVGTWIARVVIGSMWFEGSLWKLPIPSGGFQYWLEQEGQYAAFAFHRSLVTHVLLPHLTAVNVLAVCSEMGMASAFIVGFCARAAGLYSMVFAAQLYFGLYHNPSEWPWQYIFIVVISWLFLVHAAGRSLGLDAWLRRRSAFARRQGTFAQLYRWAS